MSAIDRSGELLALLQACREAPGDDAPRHVLADLLDDHGESDRAFGVRTSCAIERLARFDPRRELGRARIDDPRGGLGRWLAPLRERFPGACLVGGLVRISFAPADLLARSVDEVPADFLPWLETLRLRGFTTGLQLLQLARRGWLRPFTALDLDQTGLGDPVFQALLLDADSPGHLAHIARLEFSYNHLSDAGVRAFTEAESLLPALRCLAIGVNRRVGDAGAEALAVSPLLGRLTELNLNYTNLTAAGVSALASSPHAGNLTALDLGLNSLGAEGVRALARSRRLTRLRYLALSAAFLKKDDLKPLGEWPADRPLDHLDLSSNDNAEPGHWLARSPLAASLRELDLGGAPQPVASLEALLKALPGPRLEQLCLRNHDLGEQGARALAGCPGLAGLRALNVARAGVGPAGVLALALSPHLAGLEFLDLSDNPIGPAGYQALTRGTVRARGGAAAPTDPFPRLRAAGLARTRPTRRGVEALAGSRLLARLECLDLSYNRLGAAGALALAGSPAAAGLRLLELMTCTLGDEGVAALARSPHLGGLVGLNLVFNHVTDAAALALARSRWLGGLASLLLRANQITDRGGKALLNCRSQGWAQLDVRYNRLGEATLGELLARSVRMS